MPAWQGKSRGTTLGYRIFVSILKNFGVASAYWLLRFVALYFWLFSYKSSRPLFHYFHQKLGYGRMKSLAMLYTNYYRFGQTLIDKVVVMAGIRNKFTYHFDGEDNLHKMAALKKGGLLLSAHLGNWEIAGHLFTRLGTRINIVMFDGEDRQIKNYLEQVTGKPNMNIIVIKDDISHIYAINDAFKNNELVCMHADRFVEGNKSISGNFMGEDARFPIGPFVLAATFKVPVSYVFAFKETNRHYHLYASEVKEYRKGSKDTVTREILADFIGQMENKVKQYPEQWFNYYNFWQQS
ncbi:MAG: lipid A biosynthesis acyltransferase [Chitinophagaceae bacterium]|nr:lipid A biosynthesis acyltransferase [Chitinophagaceae bacterium]